LTNEKPLWYKEGDEAKPIPQSAKRISHKIGETLRTKREAAR